MRVVLGLVAHHLLDASTVVIEEQRGDGGEAALLLVECLLRPIYPQAALGVLHATLREIDRLVSVFRVGQHLRRLLAASVQVSSEQVANSNTLVRQRPVQSLLWFLLLFHNVLHNLFHLKSVVSPVAIFVAVRHTVIADPE